MSRRRYLGLLLATVGPLLAAAPVLAGDPVAPGDGLEIAGAWVRALPPTQSNTAAYLSLRNAGAAPLRIVEASAELAGRVEIHHSTEVDGLMRMQQLQQLDLAAGASLELAPGGIHLMLLDLERMPAVGETLEICLQSEAGAATCTRAPVRKAAALGAEESHQHHH